MGLDNELIKSPLASTINNNSNQTFSLKLVVDGKSVYAKCSAGDARLKRPSSPLTQALVPVFFSQFGVTQSTHIKLSPGQAVPLHHRFSCFSYSSAASALVSQYVRQKDKLIILCWCTFLRSPASRHPPETRCLPSSDYSHSFPPVIHPFAASCSPSLWMLLSFLAALRFSASFQAGFKQLCETSKFPLLCGLFRKADNDIPNPADLQQIPLAIPHLWLCRFNQQLPLFS